MNMADYPADWPAFSKRIRFERAKGQCECEGECGLHNGTDLFHPAATRCIEMNGQRAKFARGHIVLTVAHLNAKGGPCQCLPLCAIDDHVKAMCNRCHLRYDSDRHVENRKKA